MSSGRCGTSPPTSSCRPPGGAARGAPRVPLEAAVESGGGRAGHVARRPGAARGCVLGMEGGAGWLGWGGGGGRGSAPVPRGGGVGGGPAVGGAKVATRGRL